MCNVYTGLWSQSRVAAPKPLSNTKLLDISYNDVIFVLTKVSNFFTNPNRELLTCQYVQVIIKMESTQKMLTNRYYLMLPIVMNYAMASGHFKETSNQFGTQNKKSRPYTHF